jgi:hypothetical protein
MAGLDERRGRAARAHDAGMPKPFINPLAIQNPCGGSVPVLALELLLECRQLGEG